MQKLTYNKSNGAFYGNLYGWDRFVCSNETSSYNQRLGLPVVTEFRNPENTRERVFLGVKPSMEHYGIGYAEYRDGTGNWQVDTFSIDKNKSDLIGWVMLETVENLVEGDELRDRKNSLCSRLEGRRKRGNNLWKFRSRKGEEDPRVISVGFYDHEDVWFYVFDASRPNEEFSHECANGVDGDYVVRYKPDNGEGCREMTLGNYLKKFLPE